MEGFRISSDVPGTQITSQAFAQGLDWLPQVSDGTYCGTMGQNRSLESIKLSLDSAAGIDDLFIFNYRVYVKDIGWTDWMEEGQEAGTPSSGQPIQAIEVTLKPIEITLD